MPPSITYTSSVVARSGSSPTSFIRRAVIHEPTRNAVAIISPNVLIGKFPMWNRTGYMGARGYGRARNPATILGELAARKREVEAGAGARIALDPDPPAAPLDDLLHDREAHSRSAAAVRSRADALEHLEDLLAMRRIDAAPVVGHDDLVLSLVLVDQHLDPGVAARPHVIDCIADQVREHLVHARPVAEYARHEVRRQHQIDPGRFEPRLELRGELQQYFARIDQHGALAGLADARELEQIVDQRLHRARGLLDSVEEVVTGLIERGLVILAQQPGEAEQPDQRRAQVVSDRPDAVLELFVRVAQPLLDRALFGHVAQHEGARPSRARCHRHFGNPLAARSRALRQLADRLAWRALDRRRQGIDLLDALREQRRDRAGDQLVGGRLEQPERGAVRAAHEAPRVDCEHGVGQHVEQARFDRVAGGVYVLGRDHDQQIATRRVDPYEVDVDRDHPAARDPELERGSGELGTLAHARTHREDLLGLRELRQEIARIDAVREIAHSGEPAQR